MASSKDYLDFILDQLSDLKEISCRTMMGEYILYYRRKIIGGIYDDRFLVTAVYSKYIDVDMPFRQVMKDYTLPPFESIRRSRQKVQEGREDLRGDKKSEDVRLKKQEEYIRFAREGA